MTRSGRVTAMGVAVSAASLGATAACSTESPQLPTISSHRVVTQAPLQTRETLPLWDPASVVPSGVQVAELRTHGDARITIPTRPEGKLTIRIACVGPGKVEVSDAAGVITRLSACSGSMAVSAGLAARRRPSMLGVTAGPTTIWHAGVWVE